MDLGSDGKLLLVGCGKMGSAMLTGWLSRGLPAERVAIQEPKPAPDLAKALADAGIVPREAFAATEFAVPPAIILMAVKPQVMEAVYRTVTPLIGPETMVLSVAAGRTIASFEAPAPAGTAVVRAIPNTPAAVGRGITVCCANGHVTERQRSACESLLAAIGEVGWVEDEALIDAATAVSGSGPAYVFLLAECLAQAGAAVGLAPDLARRLADATVSGAGELMRQSDEEPAQLRRNVTSPNGTTQAALDVLMREPDGLKDLMREAVVAAARRSRELSS